MHACVCALLCSSAVEQWTVSRSHHSSVGAEPFLTWTCWNLHLNCSILSHTTARLWSQVCLRVSFLLLPLTTTTITTTTTIIPTTSLLVRSPPVKKTITWPPLPFLSLRPFVRQQLVQSAPSYFVHCALPQPSFLPQPLAFNLHETTRSTSNFTVPQTIIAFSRLGHISASR